MKTKEKVQHFLNESKKKIQKNQPKNELFVADGKGGSLVANQSESGPKVEVLGLEDGEQTTMKMVARQADGQTPTNQATEQKLTLQTRTIPTIPTAPTDELQESIKSIQQIESILNENTEIHKKHFFKELKKLQEFEKNGQNNFFVDDEQLSVPISMSMSMSVSTDDDKVDSDDGDDSVSTDENDSVGDSQNNLQDILKDLPRNDNLNPNSNPTDSKNCAFEIGNTATISHSFTNGNNTNEFGSNRGDVDINGSDEEDDMNTSELMASTNASSIRQEKSIEKSNENVMDSSIEKNQSDEIKRQKIEKTQFEEGEYSMSFESITDLKNQEFPKDETISNFESRKEMETFDDTISSISIDDRPSESFLKQDQLDLLESAFVNNVVLDSVSVLKSTPDSKIVEQDQKSPTPKNATVTQKKSSPIHQPVLFQESQLHAIQKANEQTMPIVVQSSLKTEETFLTFAQLLEMNESNEKGLEKKESSFKNKKPVKVQVEEKIMKKAILQKANSKIKAYTGTNTKINQEKKSIVKSLTTKPCNTKKPAAVAKSPTSPKKTLQKLNHFVNNSDSHMKFFDSSVKSSGPNEKSKVPIPASLSASSPRKSNQNPIEPLVHNDLNRNILEEKSFHDSKSNSLLKPPYQDNLMNENNMKENATFIQKISEMELQSQKLILQLDNEKKLVQEQQKELEGIKQQNRFLENLLQEKEEAIAVPSTGSHHLQKKLDDQEYLIRGYQTENEKLVLQNKELKKSTKDLEHRQFLKLEAVQRDITTLKTQLELSESALKKFGSISNTQATLTIEELKSSEIKLKRDLETQKEDSRRQVIKYEALLADSNKRVEEAVSSHPEHIKKMIADMEEKRALREKYIVELETKLEWHVGNHDIFNQVQQRIDRYEKTIEQLNQALDSQIVHNGKLNQHRSVNDIKKIKQLEIQIADLEEHISHSERTLPDLGMETTRPPIANEQAIIYLKKILYEKEDDVSKLKIGHEETIKELNDQISKNNQEFSLIKDQEEKKKETGSIADGNGKEVNKANEVLSLPNNLNQEMNDLSSLYKKRVVELEKELAEQKNEANDFEKKMSKKLQEKEGKLLLAQSKLKNLERQYQSKMDEISKSNPDVDAVRAELESKNATLSMKLELAEQAHQSIHESTLKLMKSSQEQASRMAFEHSKQSLDILRSELRKEQAAQTAALLESFKKRIYELESKLADSENPNDGRVQELENKLFSVERELQNVITIHAGCEERFKVYKEGSPPSALELDRLLSRIYELEAGAKNRELILKQALEKQSNEAEMQNLVLMKDLRLKESQIKKFKTEMDLILRGIQQARNVQ